MASFIAGPFAATLLGDLGADVIKVEPAGGDPLRKIGGILGDGHSATFAFANRGKRGVELDLSSEEGRGHLARLVEAADVVVHNRRPESARRLGLDAAPVVVAISAFGETGPYAERPALDPIVQAMSGIAALTGEPDGEPRRAATPVVDVAASLTAALGALAALRAGGERTVTVSLFEVGLLLNASGFAMQSARGEPLERLGNASHALITDQFAAADGLVWLAVWEERQWRERLRTARALRAGGGRALRVQSPADREPGRASRGAGGGDRRVGRRGAPRAGSTGSESLRR